MKRVLLETFLTLSRFKHFGKTASHLNTTQSTVSGRIAVLEEELSVTLFNREPRGVTLTSQGRDLLDHAVQVLESMDRMAQAAGVDPYRAGTLRLALSETLAATVLPGFIEAFSAKHPEANVEMSVNSTAGQRAQLLDRAVDLAFLMGPVSEFRVANLPLIDLPMTWIISANHPLASVQKLSAEDLVNTPIMSYATDSRPFAELSDALKRIGIHKPKLFSSNALGASLSITQAGLAIATMPQVFAKPHLEAGDLVEVKAPISLNPLRFTASFRIETGNDLAAAAAELSVEAAKKWIATQSEKPIE